MSEHQRIHPVHDPEAPLFPSGTSSSDQGNPGPSSRPPIKKRSCCCKFFCWTISLLLLLIIIIGALVGIIFLVFQPKLPKYSIDKLQIAQFNLSNDAILSATFDVTITANNPNKKIGIYYEGGSKIRVYYTSTKLCEGSLPKFYQGHRNTTILSLPLSGRTTNANSLLTSMQQEQQATGVVALNLKVNQPVRIKLGKLKLMKFKFVVKCNLDVDSLTANNVVSIKNSKCSYRLSL